MTTDRVITRRRLLQAAAGSSFAVYWLANGSKIVAQTPSAAMEYTEAPALAELVSAGSLPPVAERLPVNPLVVEPAERIGQYGGTWNTALVGGGDTSWLARTVGYDYLLRFSPQWEEIVPGLASAYEVNAESTQYTFTLREGTKWSDGAPFTTEDILFYANDYPAHPQLGGGGGTNPFTVEAIDEVTFTVTFENPYGLFLTELASSAGAIWTQFPKHYLSQFHEAYNTTNLDQLIEEAGAADWEELFRLKGAAIVGTPYNAVWSNPDLPRLYAWRMVQPYGDVQRVTFERNPYYWKVDPEGKQLPYIDNVHFDVVQDNEVLLLRVANGDLNMHARHINTLQNKPVLSDARESAGFHFIELQQAIMNTGCYMLNMSHKDLALREIFLEKVFRIGLSHAINRQEIIDAVYVSQGEPWQCAPRPETPFYNELLAKQYTEFDVDLANEYLDKVLPEKDADGWRLRPDGERLTFVLEVASGGQFAELVDVSNLVVGYWQAVGVNAQLSPEDRSLLFDRTAANEHDAAVWPGGSGLFDALTRPYMYVPHANDARYGVGWAYWWEDSESALAEPVEPPEPVKQALDLYRQVTETADEEEQYRLMAEIMAIAQEQFYAIGISLPAPGYGIVKDNFMNVPPSMPDSTQYPTPGPTNTEQYFIDQ